MLGACAPFFDPTPRGEIVEGEGSDTAVEVTPYLVDHVYRIEGRWQSGPVEPFDPPGLNASCTPTGPEGGEGEWLLLEDGVT